MNTVLIACAVALAATAILAVVFLLVRRSQSEDRLADVVDRFNDRMESMVRDVSRALERAQEEVLPARDFGVLTSSIDLDEVLTRTLEAAAACLGVDAVIVAVDEPSAPPVAAAVGIALDESPPAALSAPPDGSAPRSISVVYEYGPQTSEGGDAIRAGVAVPLLSDGEHIGYLAAYTRGSVHLFGEAQ